MDETAQTPAEELEGYEEPGRDHHELFAGISHELRGSLSFMRDSLRDLGDGRFGPLTPAARRQVGQMRVHAAALLEWVDLIRDQALHENLGIAGASFLVRVSTAIDEHLSDEDFDVGALSAQLSMSRSLLYRRLRELGLAPAGLIMERRLRRAAQLLAGGAGTVCEVAVAVGFKSASHFTQCFRERFDMTPSAYRATFGHSQHDCRPGLREQNEVTVHGHRHPGLKPRATS